MSDREEFEKWFDANQVSPFEPYDHGKKTVMWEAWQAARAHGDEEPVAWQDPDTKSVIGAALYLEAPASVKSGYTQPLYTHPPAAKVPDWTNRLNTCKHHGDDHEACAVYGGRVPCDAEGGEAVPECYVDRLERLLAGIENIRRNAGGDGYLWGYANAMHRDLKELLSTTPQPDKWIPCSERLPTEDDGFIWVYSTHTKAVLWRPHTWREINMWTEREKCLWMPANLRKPTPPEQESE